MKKSHEKYIYRMDYERVKGWFLNIDTKGIVYKELFSPKKLGGVHRALQYARDTKELVLALVAPAPAAARTKKVK